MVQSKTFTYRLSTGYTCSLTGWTHTRTYARGFLRASAGTATATVKDLEPSAFYVWRIYQFASGLLGKRREEPSALGTTHTCLGALSNLGA